MINELNLDNELRTGDIVGSTNRTVVVSTKKQQRIPGDSYAIWVAICHKDGELHPYVVWNVIARPEGFVAEHGDYCSTIEEAMNSYIRRGGH